MDEDCLWKWAPDNWNKMWKVRIHVNYIICKHIKLQVYESRLFKPVWVSPITRIVANTNIARWLSTIFVQLILFMFSALLLLTIVIVDTSGELFLWDVLMIAKVVEFTVNRCGCWLMSVDVMNQSCGMETPCPLISGGTKFQTLNDSFVVHVSSSCWPSHTWAIKPGDIVTKPKDQ
jgi:hypothetical protein